MYRSEQRGLHFKKLGFSEYNGGLKVNHSLLTVILRATNVGSVRGIRRC